MAMAIGRMIDSPIGTVSSWWTVWYLVALPRKVPLSSLQPLARSASQPIGNNGCMVVEEVVEIIPMPEFVCAGSAVETKLDSVEVGQLRNYVAPNASMTTTIHVSHMSRLRLLDNK
jgi:hypothetical protein